MWFNQPFKIISEGTICLICYIFPMIFKILHFVCVNPILNAYLET